MLGALLFTFVSTFNMMIKTKIFCLLASWFSLTLAAQQANEFQIDFNWNSSVSAFGSSPFEFEGCVLDDEKNGIPYFTKSFFTEKGVTGFTTTIAPGAVETVNDEIDQDRREHLTSEFQVSCRQTNGGKQSFGILEIVPLRLNRLSGQVERLLDCTVNISPNKNSVKKRKALDFAQNSVLAEGTWYKMAIHKDGIYRIDKAFLEELGIDAEALNLHQFNIYGNGGEQLPFSNLAPRPDDLEPNSIFVSTQNETLGNTDYILFYGKGADRWQRDSDIFVHEKHFYSDSAYYFIRTDDVVEHRIQGAALSEFPATHTVTKFQDYQFVESDLYNLVKSGREFYGEEFDLNTSATYSFSFPNITTDNATVEVKVAARSIGGSSSFLVSAGGESIELVPAAVTESATGWVAREASGTIAFAGANSNLQVALDFTKENPEAIGWLDYIRVNATRNLQMAGSQMIFRDTISEGPGNIGLFQILQAPASLQVWDITDHNTPQLVPHTLSGSTAEFKVATDVLREFSAFSSSGNYTPTAMGGVENQNLHALQDVDLMIVCAPRLLGAAEELAILHEEDGKSVVLVTAQQVFNEFSSGNPDVTAIKMLMKMLYDRGDGDPEKQPENLLLFGDGSIYNKGTIANSSNNVITFQSANSLLPIGSYVSDDYFVFLGDDDNEDIQDKLDCGVGRIPASSTSEAFEYVNKVRRYMAENTSDAGGASCLGDQNQTPYGPWRNTIVFISDDQDGNSSAFEDEHMDHAEIHSDTIHNEYNDYDVVKLYMDAFKQESTPGGERYPEGEEAIRQRVQNGALIVTYTGHGGERGWAHERILDISTIQNWTNINRLPVFLTATCELARFDDAEFSSAGEELVMNPNGGAIAMLTTTRIVYSGSNLKLGRGFFNYALEDRSMPDLTLGEINMLTKNWVDSSDSNKRSFTLLGDPALRIAYPKREVYTTEINGHAVTNYVDTLKALQEVEMKGYVGDSDGNVLTGFSGFVYPTVYDKRTQVTTLNNDQTVDVAGVFYDYNLFNKIIYKGKASVTNGLFSFKFVVPYDINFSIDTARVSYYAVAGNLDGHGHSQRFKIGGTLAGAELNTVGPELELFINDTSFVSGGITHESPILLAKLRDDNGINTVGNGIGHDLQAILDGDGQNPIVLNDYYESDLNTYKSGEIRYQLNKLSEGTHNMKVKVWDVHNNSSENDIEFVVASSAELALEHVLNYPNPFTTHTEFFFEHNQACSMLDVRIQVFTVSGKLVKTLEEQVHTEGFRSQPIAWDGRDDFGDKIGRGVYVYRVEVRSDLGAKAEQFEKLVILN